MLVAYRNSSVTAEVAEALRKLETAAVAHEVSGIRISYSGVPARLANWAGVSEDAGPTGFPASLSMRPTGREVYLSLKVDRENQDPMRELALLWGLAIPLGFHPWTRYPVACPGKEIFHYIGDLAPLVDFLHSEGRGDLAWPSLCSAAQVLADTWGGDKLTERKIQAHLHRLGVHSGPVDGDITEETLAALRSLGFGGLPLLEILPRIEKLRPPKISQREKTHGFLTISGGRVEGFSSGGVRLIRTGAGFTVTVNSPGKAIFEFGD